MAELLESMDSRLGIFEKAPLQLAIERSTYQDFTPITALGDQQPIHFLVSGTPRQCWDLKSSYFTVKAKVTLANGGDIGNAEVVSVANNLLYSMFQEVHASLNDKPITESNTLLPAREYLLRLLNLSNDANNWLQPSVIWVKDVAGQMDIQVRAGANTAMATRTAPFLTSNQVEMLGRLPIDLANQDLVIPPNCKFEFKLTPSKDAFVLTKAHDNAVMYKLKIMEVRLYMACLELNDSALIAMSQMLETDNVRWPINKIEMKTITIAGGHQTVQRDNVFSGKLPKRITLGFVSEAAMAGSYILNPFNFQHFGLNYLALNVNGEMVPSIPYTPNFAAGGGYIRDYMFGLHDGLRKVFSDGAVNITYDEFKAGYMIYVFDLSQNKSTDLNPQVNGNIRIEAKFSAALAAPVQIIILAEYDALIELSKTEVITPY